MVCSGGNLEGCVKSKINIGLYFICSRIENIIWVEERSRGTLSLCTLPPTPHNPLSPTTHTLPPSPIAIRQSIRTWYNRRSWGTRNEWQIEIWVAKRRRRDGRAICTQVGNKCFLHIVYNWCWNAATRYTSHQILWILSEQRSQQRDRTPNAFNLQLIAQYKKPCEQKK